MEGEGLFVLSDADEAGPQGEFDDLAVGSLEMAQEFHAVDNRLPVLGCAVEDNLRDASSRMSSSIFRTKP